MKCMLIAINRLYVAAVDEAALSVSDSQSLAQPSTDGSALSTYSKVKVNFTVTYQPSLRSAPVTIRYDRRV